MLISDIKAQVKNPNKTSIYIDGKYCFALTMDQLTEQKDVRVGKDLSAERIEDLKALHKQTNLYLRLVNLCLIRPRSEFEVKTRISQILKRQPDEPELEGVIQKLKKNNYLNDEVFSKWWVEGRKNSSKGYSRRKLQAELAKKGIKSDMAKAVLDDNFTNDEEVDSLRILVQKKKGRYGDQQKLIAYLAGKGFGYGLIKQVLNEEDGGEDQSADW